MVVKSEVARVGKSVQIGQKQTFNESQPYRSSLKASAITKMARQDYDNMAMLKTLKSIKSISKPESPNKRIRRQSPFTLNSITTMQPIDPFQTIPI